MNTRAKSAYGLFLPSEKILQSVVVFLRFPRWIRTPQSNTCHFFSQILFFTRNADEILCTPPLILAVSFIQQETPSLDLCKCTRMGSALLLRGTIFETLFTRDPLIVITILSDRDRHEILPFFDYLLRVMPQLGNGLRPSFLIFDYSIFVRTECLSNRSTVE